MTYGRYPDLKNVKKILVIKLRQLGDVLLTTPLFQVLKETCPDAEIDAYVYQEAKELLEDHPAVSEILVYDRAWKKRSFFSRLKKEISVFSQIRKKGYDLVINLTEGDRGAIGALISKAPIRVGFLPKGKIQKKIYHYLIKESPLPRHSVEKNLDALRVIGIFPPMEKRKLFFSISSIAREKVDALIQGPFILIHPGSRWRFKCWPIQKMRELTSHLLEKGEKVVFSGSFDPLELEMIEKITKGLDVLNLAGKLSLKELAALIEKSEYLISVDSLPFHLASALKKSVIALFGPTSEKTWGPWQNPFATVLTKPLSCRPCYLDGCGGSKMSDCLDQIEVLDVLKVLFPNEIKGESCPLGILSLPRGG